MGETIFRALFVTLVRPHLEYANQVWCTYKKKDVEAIEAVQRRATKLVPTLKNLAYPERLRKLELPTLAYRRARGDMVETFKVMNCVYDRSVSEGLFMKQDESVTRGHEKKIFKQRPRLDIRKHSFCNRVVNSWNSLPNSVVNATSVLDFERRLDRVWKNQKLKFDYTEMLQYIYMPRPQRPLDNRTHY